MNRRTSPPMRAALCLVAVSLAVAMQLLVAPTAGATPPPKRPHPHRKPWPITLTIRTVPTIAGIRVQLDDKTAVTDDLGQATFRQEHNFAPHTLRLVNTTVKSADRQLRFVRWAGQRDPNQAYRSTVTGLPMRLNYTVTAGFAVQRPVTVRLVNLQNQPLDPTRVSAVTLRAGRGDPIQVPVSGRIWLDAVVPVYRNSTIVLADQSYALASVMVGGANTVDAGRQKFTPSTTPNPTFTTKFFDLTVTAHDLLFKGPSGQSARVTYPDGSVHTLPFGPKGRVVLSDLPRGTYSVTVIGGGAALPNQLVLSRDSTVDLPIATHLDYGAIAGITVTGMLLLLLLGRGRRPMLTWMGRLIRRWREHEPASDPVEVEPERETV
jgi:hypothetical protein